MLIAGLRFVKKYVNRKNGIEFIKYDLSIGR